jgi:choline kinase
MSVSHAVVIATRPAFEAGHDLSSAMVAAVRRSLETLAKLNVRHVAVVDGRHAEELRERLALHELPQLEVEVIANLSWRNLSGSALLLAKRFAY